MLNSYLKHTFAAFNFLTTSRKAYLHSNKMQSDKYLFVPLRFIWFRVLYPPGHIVMMLPHLWLSVEQGERQHPIFFCCQSSKLTTFMEEKQLLKIIEQQQKQFEMLVHLYEHQQTQTDKILALCEVSARPKIENNVQVLGDHAICAGGEVITSEPTPTNKVQVC